MMKRILGAIVVLAVLGAAAWAWAMARDDTADSDALVASGTIEVTETRLGTELAGRVAEVLVAEGDEVRADDPLVRLDPTLLDAQRRQAEAGVETATRARDAAAALFDDALAGFQAAARAGAPAAEAAQARVSAARTQLSAAEGQLGAARAALDVLEVQRAKLTLSAPSDGTILTRAVEPGEVVGPAATLLVLGRLDAPRITVYVPEDRVGEIAIGARADVAVDTFPDERFAATVAHVDSRAQFTPRNVQTGKGRRTTVFAVRLDVVDPRDRLKPGMPADVTFRE